jgi:hypothetical protein
MVGVMMVDLATNKNILSNSKPFVKSSILPRGHRFFPDCLREAQARWLEWNVTRHNQTGWFVTLTFKTFISISHAERLRNTWLARLAEASRTVNKGGRRLRWICATEWQLRDVVHFHLLVMAENIDLLSRMRWEHRWQTMDMITGFCRVYNADYKAAPYLAKYCSKSLRGELARGGYWRGLKTPNSLSCGCSQAVFSDESRASWSRR